MSVRGMANTRPFTGSVRFDLTEPALRCCFPRIANGDMHVFSEIAAETSGCPDPASNHKCEP